MTDAEIAELTRLAQGATPGPWRWSTDMGWRRLHSDAPVNWAVMKPFINMRGRADCCIYEQDAAYIAAANPQRVLGLLARLRAAEAGGGAYMGQDCCVCGLPIHGVMVGMGDGSGSRFGHRDCYERDRAKALEHERDQLLAALAAAREALERYGGHDDACAAMDEMRTLDNGACDCGLDTASAARPATPAAKETAA